MRIEEAPKSHEMKVKISPLPYSTLEPRSTNPPSNLYKKIDPPREYDTNITCTWNKTW